MSNNPFVQALADASARESADVPPGMVRCSWRERGVFLPDDHPDAHRKVTFKYASTEEGIRAYEAHLAESKRQQELGVLAFTYLRDYIGIGLDQTTVDEYHTRWSKIVSGEEVIPPDIVARIQAGEAPPAMSPRQRIDHVRSGGQRQQESRPASTPATSPSITLSR